MLAQGNSFEDHLAVLAVLLMRAHGDKIVVTQDEVDAAREFMRDHDIQLVTFDQFLLFRDEIVVEFRHKSRVLVRGEVV